MEVKAIGDSSQIGARLLSASQSREVKAQAGSQQDQSTTGTTEETKQAVKKCNEILSSETNLRMHYDDDIHQVIITVVDAGTEQVIRQIPSEELVSFAKNFDQYLGALYDGRV
jgi:flagellar protein FlaG